MYPRSAKTWQYPFTWLTNKAEIILANLEGRGYCKFPTAAQRSAAGGRETKTNRELG